MDFKEKIAQLISNIVDMNKSDIKELIEVPQNCTMGDYALPCFKLAKELKKSPGLIAKDITEKIPDVEYFEKVGAVNGYVNFFVQKEFFISGILSDIINKKEEYGKSDLGKGKNIVIDYSSPNVAKPFHAGHLRSTVIGKALYNIFNFIGYNSIGINHLGDWGTQFGKLIMAYKNWGDKETVERDDVKELSRIYVKYHEESEKNPSLDDEARGWFVKMQNGDKEALDLWKWFIDISMKEYNRIYERLNIKFDYFTGESFYNDKMDAVVDELKEKNLLTKSEGAEIVELDNFNMPPCLIIRSDGGTLYPTRDISAAFYRKKEYDFDKCIYVTAFDQNLHFAQWFKVIELMGYDWSDRLIHVPFGLVNLPDGKMSTRSGRVVLMEDILNSAVNKAINVINEKNPELENKEQVAEQVGIGAIIFNDLYNSRIKNVVLDLDKMLNFDGETGPYVQYTYARTCSLLKKGNVDENGILGESEYITDEASYRVIKLLEEFPAKVIDAADKYEPYIVTRHIVDICQAFNKFYHDNNILGSEEKIKKSRLSLTFAVNCVINSGLKILGIDAPERM